MDIEHDVSVFNVFHRHYHIINTGINQNLGGQVMVNRPLIDGS